MGTLEYGTVTADARQLSARAKKPKHHGAVSKKVSHLVGALGVLIWEYQRWKRGL